MAVTSTWTVVRDILSADMTLTADQVIARAKTKGVKAPDDAIRTTVHTLRKRLKKKAAATAATAPPPSKPAPAVKPPAAAKAASAPKPVPAPKSAAAATQRTAAPAPKAGRPAAPVVRAILSADMNLSADVVIARAKARGVTASEESIRNAVHNIRSELKKGGARPAPPAQAAANAPSAPAGGSATSPPVAGVLANVAQVHAAVAACGGVEHARQVAEAVRACGGAEAFGMYLDLVAGIGSPGPRA